MRTPTTLKPLSQIAAGFEVVGNWQIDDVQISGITHDSRQVQPGDLYVALPGSNHHGIEFIDHVLNSGAVAVATDEVGLAKIKSSNHEVPTVLIENPRADMASLAARVFDHPEAKLTIVGVTGTNGKTSITHMLQSLFTKHSYQVGVIGTIGTYIAGNHIYGARTTPESTDLYALLAQMVDQNITHVFMEVSSHALEMHRVDGLNFAEVVFTNLSQDHLDFHGTMENYFAAKAKLFTKTFAKHATICIEDSWGARLANQSEIPVSTVGKTGDWQVGEIKLSVGKTEFALKHDDSVFNCELAMIGEFNAINAATTVAVATSLGLPLSEVSNELSELASVPGRSQVVAHSSPGTAIVDYAHTPEAVEKTLASLREVCEGQLIAVLGCGGDRDKTKRPLMGAIAAQLADVVIITDDNPRTEDPAAIRAEVTKGAQTGDAQVVEVGDRRAAIRAALTQSGFADVVAVLGKGHEEGQEINGVVHPFNDVIVIKEEAELLGEPNV